MKSLIFERSPLILEGIKDAESVELLEIAFCNAISLDGVECLANLRTLRIHYCRLLSDISALAKLSKLQSVTFYSTPKLTDYSPLKSVASLVDIELNGSYKVSSIRPFRNLPNLRHLTLSRVKVADGDYSPILENAAIQEVFWHGAPFPPPALSEIKRQRPKLLIGGNGVFAAARVPKGSEA